MARRFAGILAATAMTVALLQAARHGSSFDWVVTTGAAWTIFFGVVGWVIGLIASQTVDASVQARLEKELAGWNAEDVAKSPAAPTDAG